MALKDKVFIKNKKKYGELARRKMNTKLIKDM